jgi:hypothetical protein
MSNILGPPVGYIDLLDFETRAQLKKDQEDGKHFQKNPIRPSSSGNCTRELFYQSMMYHGKASYDVPTNEPNVHRLFSLGHSIETHLIRQFEAHLKMVEVRYKQQVLDFGVLEAPTDKNLSMRLEGSLDFCLISDEWKCVLDVKSKKDKFSSYRGSKWDEDTDKLAAMQSVTKLSGASFWVDDLEAFLIELNDPWFEANFLQLNLYANSEFIKQRGINHGAIIQYSKNDSRLREIRFRPSAKVYEKTLDKFKRVIAAVEAGDETLAPKDHVLGTMKCAFCPFAKQCWNEDSLKAWFKTFPKKQWPTRTEELGEEGESLEKLFALLAEQEVQARAKERTEESILKIMAEKELPKVKLSSGDVFEAKHYKSPRPHFELKRSKP